MKVINPDTDSILIRSLQQGDHRAFEKLFKRYAQKLFTFSVSYLKNENNAEEVVQEVFLKVWTNRLSLKTETSFQSYLFTIAFNAIKKSFNKRAKDDSFKLDLIDVLDTDQDRVDFERNYQLVAEKLDRFIEEMPVKRKAIFILRKKHAKPVKQIAEELDISIKTVENQITEAMKYLKKRFEEELPGGLLFFFLFLDS